MNQGFATIGAIVAAIIGLAIVAVIVSKNAQTSTVITSGGSALSSVIQAAVSPVSGSAASASSLLSPSLGTFL
jgi:PRD1 phage membrane DNA delivery